MEGRKGVLWAVAPPPQSPLGFEGQPSYPEGLGEVAPPPPALLHSEEEQGIQRPARLLLILGVVLVGAVGDLWVQLGALEEEEGVLVRGQEEWRPEWSLLL